MLILNAVGLQIRPSGLHRTEIRKGTEKVNKSTSQQVNKCPFLNSRFLGVLFLIFYIYYNIYKI